VNIPFFRYPAVFRRHRDQLLGAFVEAADAGAFILQRHLKEFEERLAAYCGTRFAVGVANATDGLEMNLKLAGVGPGDEVILPSHTMVATASAVVAVGGRPIFAEIGADHLLDPSDVEHRITERTRAIMPVQLNGRTCEMGRIQDLARRHGLAVVEDSAQGLGSRFEGRMAGTFGVAGVYSFYPAKLLGALGDGGAIVTDDEGAAQELRELRDHGRDPATGDVVRWGRNSRLDNLQAAMLAVKLGYLDEEIAWRRRLACRYHEGLRDVPQLVLPPPPDDRETPRHFDTFQNYEIEAEDRDALKAFLARHGVGTMIQWGGKGIHQYPALRIGQSLPRTEAILARSLMLPMNSSVTDQEADYIVEQIRAFYAGR
jgi:dTDP-4-amino-4,6-dideoxygalactose transaminase